MFRLATECFDYRNMRIILMGHGSLTDNKVYPSTLITPEQEPIKTAPHGSITMSATAPTATPPARVAF